MSALARRHVVAAAALAAVSSLLAAAPAAATTPVVVDMRDNRFIPQTLTVKVGTTVRWTNSERRTSHSVLFTGEGGFESPRMFPGESWEHRFDRPGRFPYICGPHPEMRGEIVVE